MYIFEHMNILTNVGLVHLPESLKLGSFLCKMLQCCAARLSSKIRKGKKVFHSKRSQEGVQIDASEIAHYRRYIFIQTYRYVYYDHIDYKIFLYTKEMIFFTLFFS
jgi:phosphatidylserine/phosphatidylglycerophosphate/cardiolipin synthase-like enzyme